ncbi:hypothetical protein [Sutcliffiella sp. FSL R7-0096]|uniref:hypothetical protein n=2 Tax=unclassified Sutcliffiella TaxID=2837532 RepID=UPI00315A8081
MKGEVVSMGNFNDLDVKVTTFFENLTSGKYDNTIAFWKELAELLVSKGKMNKEQAMWFVQNSTGEIVEIVARFIEREMKR